MRMGAVMMRLSNLTLTSPAVTGLIMVTVLVLGAIVVRGTTAVNAFGAGNSTVLYSRDAIVMEVGTSLGYRTLAWNEQ